MAITIQQGMDQSTPAMKAIIGSALGTRRVARVRRAAGKVKRAARKVRKAASNVRSNVKKLKKGSAAAKAWGKRMAKLRKG